MKTIKSNNSVIVERERTISLMRDGKVVFRAIKMYDHCFYCSALELQNTPYNVIKAFKNIARKCF
jgi:hypothetical protein